MSYTLRYIGATWCGTCKTIKPQAEELCKKFSVLWKEFDIDELADDEKDTITKVPTLQIYKDGKEHVTWNVNQIKSLEAWLQQNITLTTTDF
jgi:thiol-disulfide isomerase/thioredoxin